MRRPWRARRWLLVGIGLAVLGGLGCASQNRSATPASAGETPGAITVRIEDGGFVPDRLTIERGTTVTWTNVGTGPHTVSRPLEGGIQVAGPDSPVLSRGESYAYTYTAVGIFDYHCRLHPLVGGSVSVKPPIGARSPR